MHVFLLYGEMMFNSRKKKEREEQYFKRLE